MALVRQCATTVADHRELHVTMALAGVTRIADIGPHHLDPG